MDEARNDDHHHSGGHHRFFFSAALKVDQYFHCDFRHCFLFHPQFMYMNISYIQVHLFHYLRVSYELENHQRSVGLIIQLVRALHPYHRVMGSIAIQFFVTFFVFNCLRTFVLIVSAHLTICDAMPRHALSTCAVEEMWRYIALVGTLISMHGLNSYCLVTPCFLLIDRLRVVSNFGDGDCGMGKIHTCTREISRRRNATRRER